MVYDTLGMEGLRKRLICIAQLDSPVYNDVDNVNLPISVDRVSSCEYLDPRLQAPFRRIRHKSRTSPLPAAREGCRSLAIGRITPTLAKPYIAR